ncbi:MAG: DUF6585 family protein [Gemmataceae bacterium]
MAAFIESNDPDVVRATAELGAPDAHFTITARWFWTRMGLGLALLAYGVIINVFWWTIGPGLRGHFEVHILVVPPVIGLGLLLHMYRNRGLHVLIYPTGLLKLQRGIIESFPWDEVQSVRLKLEATEPVIEENGTAWLPVTVPRFQQWTTWMELTRADGASTRLTPALAEFEELTMMVQLATFLRLWEPVEQILLAGGEVPILPGVSVSHQGIVSGDNKLRWKDLKEIVIRQRSLSITRNGGWLPWLLKDISEIQNPHVFWAAVDRLRPTPPKDDE